LRAAKILLIGLDGLGAEVAKNIILAGVKSVTFLDHRNATKLDRCSQFLVPKKDIGMNVNIIYLLIIQGMPKQKLYYKKKIIY